MTIEDQVQELKDDVKFLKDLVLKALNGKSVNSPQKTENGKTPGLADVGSCKKCNAEIQWVISNKGKSAMCDPGLIDGHKFGTDEWWITAEGYWHKGPDQKYMGFASHKCGQKREETVDYEKAVEALQSQPELEEDDIPF